MLNVLFSFVSTQGEYLSGSLSLSLRSAFEMLGVSLRSRKNDNNLISIFLCLRISRCGLFHRLIRSGTIKYGSAYGGIVLGLVKNLPGTHFASRIHGR